VIQHFPADAPWYLERAMAAARVAIDLRRVDRGDSVPNSLEEYSALVVLGGPASAAQESNGYPSLEAEMRLFVEAHGDNKPALGVCLGAQALARAAGARVYPGTAGKEIGWGKMRVTPEAAAKGPLARVGDELTVLHWHGDTFDLPEGAKLLASSDAYPNQAFQWGSCLGLQPHLEVDSLDGVRAFIEAFPEEAELAEGGADAILSATPEAIRRSEPGRLIVLAGWAHSIGAEQSVSLT